MAEFPDPPQESTAEGQETSGIHLIEDIEEQKKFLTFRELERFAQELLSGTFEPVMLEEATRIRLEGVLHPTTAAEPSPKFWEGIKATEEWRESVQYAIDSITTLLETGSLCLVVVDGKAAGVAGIGSIGSYQNRPVSELKHVTVLPEYRGRGISKLLTWAIAGRARAADPNSYLLAYSKSPQVESALRSAGSTQVLSPKEYSSIDVPPEYYDSALARRTIKQELGWKALLLDLNGK